MKNWMLISLLMSTMLTSVYTQENKADHTRPVKYEILKDSRDNQTYKAVKIGTQTWMAENLNYQTEDSWCYNNDSAMCAKYGRLYKWKSAQSGCPEGWHLPSNEEWNLLAEYISDREGGSLDAEGNWSKLGNLLKSKSGWDNYEEQTGNGSNKLGFITKPSGSRGMDGRFFGLGTDSHWWSKNFKAEDDIYAISIFHYQDKLLTITYNPHNALSVRCVK